MPFGIIFCSDASGKVAPPKKKKTAPAPPLPAKEAAEAERAARDVWTRAAMMEEVE